MLRAIVIVVMLFGILSIDASEGVSAQEDYCCIIEDVCSGPYDGFYSENPEIDSGDRERARVACEEQGGTLEEEGCPDIGQCVSGCCIFYDGTRWTHNYDVSLDSCMDVYDRSFFDPEVPDRVRCEAMLYDELFPVYFNIMDEDGRQVEIDLSESFVQEVGDTLRCDLDYIGGNDDYNYGVDCDGSGRLGFGTYLVSVIAEIDGQTYRYSGNIWVYGEDIFEIVLDPEAEVDTVDVTGQVFEYEIGDDDQLIPTERHIPGASVTISGLNLQTTTDTDGSFKLENVPAEDGYRTVTIMHPDFRVWSSEIFLPGDEDMGHIYIPEADDPVGQVCCPDILGCSGNQEGSSTCYAGQGQYGKYCEGMTASEACNVPPMDCCADAKLCPEEHRSDASCSGQGCNVPCRPTRQCLQEGEDSAQVTSVCMCGPGNYIDNGFCCRIGDSYMATDPGQPCDDFVHEITGIVLAKRRRGDGFLSENAADATVYFTSEEGVTIRAITGSDGTFSVALPEGEYRSDVFKSGYITDDNVKRLSVSSTGDEGDGFEHIITESRFIDSPSVFDDPDIAKQELETEVDRVETEIPENEYNLIYAMDYSMDSCYATGEWDILSAHGRNVQGRQEVRLEWDFQDCQELDSFRIERRSMIYERRSDSVTYDTGDGWELTQEDDEFRQIATVPSARREYTDENVRWSSQIAVENGHPAIYPSGSDEFMLAEHKDQEIRVYEYRVQPVFADHDGDHYDDIEVVMGEEICETRDAFSPQFCAYNSMISATDPAGSNTLGEVLDSDGVQQSILLRALRTLRVQCDSENRLELREDCHTYEDEDYTVRYYDSRIYSGPSCVGPDDSGMTQCKERDMCRGYHHPLHRHGGRGAFGMLEPLLHLTEGGNECYGPESGDRYENMCVLQPDRTTSDRCVYCEEVRDCTDYTSEESCGIDNCMVGNPDETGTSCRWIDTAMSDAGEGLCIPAEIRPSENFCELAGRDNVPFDVNVGWSDEFCNELGDCFSTYQGGCQSCEDIMSCEDYYDESQCTGNPNIRQPIDVAYPKPEDDNWEEMRNTCAITGVDSEYFNRSNDGCGIGNCRWDPTQPNPCFRDATSTGESDYGPELEPFNNEYPELVPETGTELLFSGNDGFTDLSLFSDLEIYMPYDRDYDFAGNRFGFRFCIDKDDNCCPSYPRDTESALELIQDSVDQRRIIINDITEFNEVDGDGLYYVRYIAQDRDFNIAPLESIEILVDTTPPNFTIDVSESITPDPDDERVDLRFYLESIGESAHPDVDYELISCDFDLRTVRDQGISEFDDYPQEGQYQTEHWIDYTVEPGLYRLEVTCNDRAQNEKTEILHIRADGQENLNVINPRDGGAVPDQSRIPFRIETQYPSECSISWPRSDDPEDRRVEDMLTDDGFEHELYDIVDLDSWVGEGPVYDDVFHVRCIEKRKHCTVGGEQCETHADCANGHCEREDISHPITFVRDGIPPETTLQPFGEDGDRSVDISERRRPDPRNGTDGIRRAGKYFYNNNVSIDLSCEGIAPDGEYPSLKAWCKEDPIEYCIRPLSHSEPHNNEAFCGDTSNWLSYDENPDIMEEYSFSICYRSEDEVGNIEDTRCSLFFIHREKPDLDLSVDTEYVYGDSYVTGFDENSFSGSISAQRLINYDIHYLSSDDRGRTLLEVVNTELRREPESFTLDVSEGSIFFSGDLPRLARVNSLGANNIRLSAEDMYGNTNYKTIYMYYDREPPMLRDFSINDVQFADEAEYGEDLNFMFRLDDVFWTNDVSDVVVNVYAHETGPLSGDFEMGAMELDYERVISPDNQSRINMTDELMEYVHKLSYYDGDLTEAQKRQRLDGIAEWKEYSFSIYIDQYFNDETRLYDMGVGEYILEIQATDPLGQEMKEYIVFNISDSSEPSIIMEKPDVYRESGTEMGDSRRRITNNPNQEFVVWTDQPAQCFFDLGTTPTQQNYMQRDSSRERHTYVLDDFQPFDRVTIPITISCTVHQTDLHTEQFSLMFDRRPLRLTVDSMRGDLVPPTVNKDHIREYQLDYTQRMFGELRPRVSVQDADDERILECRYECRSPNSRCTISSGTFPGNLQKVPSFAPTIPEEFGDYMYTLTCNDQAGNVARTRDLAFSVRDRGAPQRLYILDDSYYPTEEEGIYDEIVEFGVSTTMLSHCSVIFSEGGIRDIELSESASLTHRKSVNLSEIAGDFAGDFTYRFRCEQSTDRSNHEETREMTFSLVDVFAEISPEMFEQRELMREYVPVFRIEGLPSGIENLRYSVEDPEMDGSVIVPNTGSLVVPGISPGDMIYLKGVYESGQETDMINITAHQDTIEPQEANLDSVMDNVGHEELTTIFDEASQRDIYPLDGDRIELLIRHDGPIDRIRALVNGETRSSNSYAISSTLLEDDYRITADGDNDLYMLITMSDGRKKYLYLPISRHTEAPEIESVEPRFIGRDGRINVTVSRPSECSVLYPSSQDDKQITVGSESASTFHEFVLDDLDITGRRHEITQIHVSCSDSQYRMAEVSHMLQVAVLPPEILDITSDNSILEDSGASDYTFTTVRDEDVHITVNTDEYARCTYTDEDGVTHEFNDYFMPNLYPHASLKVDGDESTYTVSCENEAGIETRGEYTVSVSSDPDAPLYIHDAYPVDTTGERYPTVEVYTFRDARCQVDLHQEAEDRNIFFRVLDNLFRASAPMDSELVGHRYRHTQDMSTRVDSRMGLQVGQIYRATIMCQYAGDSASKDISFIYSPEEDPRPLIYIE